MRLDIYLETNEISVEEFAREVGVHRASIYRFISGQHLPRAATLAKIAQVTKNKVKFGDFGTPASRRRLPYLGERGRLIRARTG